jgi:hypothetical protein
VSPAGSTSTAHFSAGGSESGGEEQILGAIVAELESVPKTPTKTFLPEEYDASSGNTAPGFEGTWRETNARCGTDLPFVPGHTSSPRVVSHLALSMWTRRSRRSERVRAYGAALAVAL